jgi:signal transduction histidine kinase
LAGAVSAAHFATNKHHAGLHAAYEYAYYLPVLMGAYWGGTVGGLTAALLCAALYFPHIQTTWADNAPYAASQYGELVAFHMVGGIVGVLVTRLRRSSTDAQHAASALAAKNRELVESQQHLLRAERLSALGTLAAGLAHEVRTPIAAMKGALEILASRARPGTPEAEFTGVATKELSRLGSLLEDFLAYARPRPPARIAMQLAEVARQVQSLLTSEARRRDVRVEITADTEGHFTGDPAQLTQVLVNIVLNAIQASPAGEVVIVHLHETRGEVALEVVDKGAGLSQANAARIFEPFFTTKAKGTGLGLPIAQRIIAAHGGTIELVNETPTGTRALIRLPRVPTTMREG